MLYFLLTVTLYGYCDVYSSFWDVLFSWTSKNSYSSRYRWGGKGLGYTWDFLIQELLLLFVYEAQFLKNPRPPPPPFRDGGDVSNGFVIFLVFEVLFISSSFLVFLHHQISEDFFQVIPSPTEAVLSHDSHLCFCRLSSSFLFICQWPIL